MNYRKRIDRLERSIPINWPRCRTCGGYAGGGVVAFRTVWPTEPGETPAPPDPTCRTCGGPVEPDGLAPDDLLPPGSIGTVVYVEYDRPRGPQAGDEPTGMNRRTPPGLPPA